MTKTNCFDHTKSDSRSARRIKQRAGAGFLNSPAQEQIRECLAVPRVQAKLAISAPSDPCEQEADRIAEKVAGDLSESNLPGKSPVATICADGNDGSIVMRKPDSTTASSPDEDRPAPKMSDKELMVESFKIEDEIREKISEIAMNQKMGSAGHQPALDSTLDSLIRQQAANLLERTKRTDSPVILEGIVFELQTFITLGVQAEALADDILVVIGLKARKMGLFALAQMLPGGSDVFSESNLREGGNWLEKEASRLRSLIYLNNILIQYGSDRIARTANPAQKHELRKSLEPLWVEQEEYKMALKGIEENIGVAQKLGEFATGAR